MMGYWSVFWNWLQAGLNSDGSHQQSANLDTAVNLAQIKSSHLAHWPWISQKAWKVIRKPARYIIWTQKQNYQHDLLYSHSSLLLFYIMIIIYNFHLSHCPPESLLSLELYLLSYKAHGVEHQSEGNLFRKTNGWLQLREVASVTD
jgi:hypothetical protein